MSSSSPPPLPSNVHISRHPCLRAKLSLLRSQATGSRDTKALVNEIATILATEALAGLEVEEGDTDTSPIGYEFTQERLREGRITLVPILRSGLGMVDAVQAILPEPASIYHLGLFRDPSSLQPIEYYNNLPFTRPEAPAPSTTYPPSQSFSSNPSAASLAILLDPLIATGGTSIAAIQTLREWGVRRIILLSVLGARSGVERAAGEWEAGVEVWVGGIDDGVDGRGMIRPGLGDVGDRLFGTVGK